MDFSADLYRHLFPSVALAAGVFAAVSAIVLYARRRRYARLWLAHAPWLAAAVSVSLLAVAAFLWSDREEGAKAGRGARLASTDAHPETFPRGTDPGEYLSAMGKHLERQPRDARAWVLYARAQAELGRFGESAPAYQKALALSSRVAKDPSVWCEYADALAMVQGGSLAGMPRELIDRALALDSGHAMALEMAGSAEYEQGRYREALLYWRPLLAKLEPGSRMHRELVAAIERTERLAVTTSGDKPRT